MTSTHIFPAESARACGRSYNSASSSQTSRLAKTRETGKKKTAKLQRPLLVSVYAAAPATHWLRQSDSTPYLPRSLWVQTENSSFSLSRAQPHAVHSSASPA